MQRTSTSTRPFAPQRDFRRNSLQHSPGLLVKEDDLSWSASGSLVEELDKRVMVVLRDVRGKLKHLFGTMRSFDQFGNIVLENTLERVYAGNVYGERKTLETEQAAHANLTQSPINEVEQAEAAIRLKEEQENKRRKDAFGDSALGFDSEGF